MEVLEEDREREGERTQGMLSVRETEPRDGHVLRVGSRACTCPSGLQSGGEDEGKRPRLQSLFGGSADLFLPSPSSLYLCS